jgi:hypothetical protein
MPLIPIRTILQYVSSYCSKNWLADKICVKLGQMNMETNKMLSPAFCRDGGEKFSNIQFKSSIISMD